MNVRMLFLAALLSGCGTYNVEVGWSKPVIAPDGKRGFAVHCAEEIYCWEVAGRSCTRGYEILSKSSGRTTRSRGSVANVGHTSVVSAEEHTTGEVRSLLIQCK
jgi:hypothetical protein